MVREVVSGYLRRDGVDVTVVADGKAALDSIDCTVPDLVVLDIMLPHVDGLSVLAEIRNRNLDVPVVLLSARAEEEDRIGGLERGAEDYLTKPFSPRELSVRVRKILERNGRLSSSPVLSHGDLEIDTVARIVRLAGEEVLLTAKEFDLLAHLAASPRRVFTKAQLLETVWSSHEDWQDPATVTVHVGRIRSKLGDHHGGYITTLRGVGYRFDPDGTEAQ